MCVIVQGMVALWLLQLSLDRAIWVRALALDTDKHNTGGNPAID